MPLCKKNIMADIEKNDAVLSTATSCLCHGISLSLLLTPKATDFTELAIFSLLAVILPSAANKLKINEHRRIDYVFLQHEIQCIMVFSSISR